MTPEGQDSGGEKPLSVQLVELSRHLSERREAILLRWREAADADPEQTTVSVLTRAQFNDHIPPLLDAFEKKLRARPGDTQSAAADRAQLREDIQHGLERWQQGYRLVELMHEWGHLHRCLAQEIHRYAAAHREFTGEALAVACDELIRLISEGINQSVGQYARMQQAEAAGRLYDLQEELARAAEVERRRVSLIREAVHDLRANVQSVSTAAEVLMETNIPENHRVEFAKLVQKGVESVSAMLVDMTSLARLEAGQERREVTAFDAAALLRELCERAQPDVVQRKLFLRAEGPAALPVEGDVRKVRRIVQNLITNAVRYTLEGGVTVSWGQAKETWWAMIQDTGPGLMTGSSAPLAAGLSAATASARESDEKAADLLGEVPSVLRPLPGASQPAASRRRPGGEGIGLSIVKRLCDLLDAQLELSSSAKTGTSFRVVFPLRYPGTTPT